MNHGLVAALLVATAGAAGSAAAEAWDVTVGFGGSYRAGSWTPLVISPRAVGQAAAGDIVHAWAEDPDGQFVRSPPAPLIPNADGRLVARAAVRIGRPIGRLRIERVTADGPDTTTDLQLPDPLPSTRDVILVVGDLPAVRRAVRLLPRGDGPAPVVLEPFSTMPLSSPPREGIAAGAEARDYDGIDTIIVCGNAVPSLAPDNLAGIDAWVHEGGTLVLTAGVSAAPLEQHGGAAAWMPGSVERLVPLRRLSAIETFARASGLGERPEATALRVPLLANRSRLTGTIEAFDGGVATDLPLVVRRSYGLGTIVWIGLDLDAEPFRSWPATDTLLVRLLGRRVQEREAIRSGEPFSSTFDLTTQFRRALETLPLAASRRRTTPVPFEIIIGLGLLYVFCLYPLDWWLAAWAGKRGLGNSLPWLSLPLFAGAFTALAWAVADRWRPAPSACGQSVDLVDIDTESGRARGRSWAVVWSPDNATLTASLAPASLAPMPADPSAATAGAVSWFADTGSGFGGIDAPVPHPTLAATDYRASSSPAALVDVPVAAAANRLFEAGWGERGSGRVVTASLASDAQAALDGEVAHHLPFPLSDCRLAHGGWVYEIGRLAPGEIFRPRESRGPRSLSGLLTRRGAVGDRDLATRWDPTTSDIRRIFEVGVWHAAAGGTAYTGIDVGPLGRLDLSPLLADRAILSGYACGSVAAGSGFAGSGSGPDASPAPWHMRAGRETLSVSAAVRLYRIVIPLTAPAAGPAGSQP